MKERSKPSLKRKGVVAVVGTNPMIDAACLQRMDLEISVKAGQLQKVVVGWGYGGRIHHLREDHRDYTVPDLATEFALPL